MHKMHGNYFKQNQTIKLEFNNWSRFIKSNVSYTHLYEEIADYNRYWTYFLTTFFGIICILLSYVFYIVLFYNSSTIMRFLYTILFLFNIWVMTTISYICGCVIQQNKNISNELSSMMSYLKTSHQRPSIMCKVNINKYYIYYKQLILNNFFS